LNKKFCFKSLTFSTFDGQLNHTFTKQNQFIMKHLFKAFCLTLALMLVQQEAFAQIKHGLTVRALFYNYENPEPELEDWSEVFKTEGRGVEVAYNLLLDKHSTLVIPFKVGTAPKTAERNNGLQGGDELLLNLDAHMQFSLFKHRKLINPYVLLGVGSTWNVDDEFFDFNIPAGIGVNLRLARNLFINGQTQYRFSIEDRPGWHHGVGLTFFFGEDDRDEDGVLDKDDRCMDVAGVVALAGCPDKDGDGIADLDDKCPEVPGVASAMGCPDRDGDGFTDADDRCPDVAGIAAFMGCPDRDGDGITDAEDACPELAGPSMYRGCPDTDGDGLADNVDKCPREAGTAANQGCPVSDRDGDGIADVDDACPDQYGGALTKGCPDRDGDGIIDRDDRCPDKAGTVANKGCPELTKETKEVLARAVKQVQFQSGKATLLSSSYDVLNAVADLMVTHPEYSLSISGHTDSQGEEKMNMRLSESRAQACYDYLVKKGINTNRITHVGYGESKPIATNMNAAGREQNRRVEFELVVK
jgi:OOP family OmpA-OmpF porin